MGALKLWENPKLAFFGGLRGQDKGRWQRSTRLCSQSRFRDLSFIHPSWPAYAISSSVSFSQEKKFLARRVPKGMGKESKIAIRNLSGQGYYFYPVLLLSLNLIAEKILKFWTVPGNLCQALTHIYVILILSLSLSVSVSITQCKSVPLRHLSNYPCICMYTCIYVCMCFSTIYTNQRLLVEIR